MTNNADQKQILSVSRNSDGIFSAGPSHETGGRGRGGVNDPLESQGSRTRSAYHSFLFAVNSGCHLPIARQRASATLRRSLNAKS